MKETIFLKMRHRIQVKPNATIRVGDVAQVVATKRIDDIVQTPIYTVQKKDRNIVIIDVMHVMKALMNVVPQDDIQSLGPSQTIVEVVCEKKRWGYLYVPIVWLLLFIGSGLAIMNFHEDVSMQQVQQRLYRVITGKEVEKPLWFQIPYSLGLGLGMILFFNHFFKKRINEEPSPLEVEMFQYQQSLDQYVIMHENKEAMRRMDDDS
ncbi:MULTISPECIES: stage V sporulation protein AA [Anoxybacillus]|uniref:Stage V sporulation protein AA n=1 Tax=Anoxybacillus kestanbolensis TaxID=227476 RepID=A0A1V3FTD0_9BACL|nr:MULTISPECIES: stage V sporulation protein AA [Anoxybacillus]NNU89028.1 stage V sporulation protein AA [Anoxybacillus sp. CHMUD]OOE04804.1 stage V sporulation protein AA [Anoxybacillus kestanbolensis]QAV27084.1 stage V sporulation protein AA [Neobacillus thermocopriae]